LRSTPTTITAPSRDTVAAIFPFRSPRRSATAAKLMPRSANTSTTHWLATNARESTEYPLLVTDRMKERS
jgi:hypothetical protein